MSASLALHLYKVLTPTLISFAIATPLMLFKRSSARTLSSSVGRSRFSAPRTFPTCGVANGFQAAQCTRSLLLPRCPPVRAGALRRCSPSSRVCA
ncbi:unnamed protein product [Ectocarpus sp. CCAP 1310/34]|nr:unnamed protein product [Ectocarpus sp. CCAP 1310/34]